MNIINIYVGMLLKSNYIKYSIYIHSICIYKYVYVQCIKNKIMEKDNIRKKIRLDVLRWYCIYMVSQYINRYSHTQTRTHTHTHTHTHSHTHRHARKHNRTQTHKSTHTDTHTYTHKHR